MAARTNASGNCDVPSKSCSWSGGHATSHAARRSPSSRLHAPPTLRPPLMGCAHGEAFLVLRGCFIGFVAIRGPHAAFRSISARRLPAGVACTSMSNGGQVRFASQQESGLAHDDATHTGGSAVVIHVLLAELLLSFRGIALGLRRRVLAANGSTG